jgi:hypothetical protein
MKEMVSEPRSRKSYLWPDRFDPSRLAFVIPFTPWPVFFWVNSLGRYSTGRHSAEALYPMREEAVLFTGASWAVGLLLILLVRRDPWLKVWWVNVTAINAWLLWQYLLGHALAYA